MPVVARKKGLDGYYEKTDGNAQQKKAPTAVAPVRTSKLVISYTQLFNEDLQAPGTFGFDHTKYRPPWTDGESIPMDEFGRPAEQATEQDKHEPHSNAHSTPTSHDETMLPVHRPTQLSPPPFSHYAPFGEKDTSLVPNGNPPVDQVNPDGDDKETGCCSCVIM